MRLFLELCAFVLFYSMRTNAYTPMPRKSPRKKRTRIYPSAYFASLSESTALLN